MVSNAVLADSGSFVVSCQCVEQQHTYISKEKEEDEEQRSAPLEAVPSVFDCFPVSKPAVQFKKARIGKLPSKESSKKWRKFPYSPQWVSMLDVAQKILDEEDRIKKIQKENKTEGEDTQADETFEEGEKENKEEPLAELVDAGVIQPTTVEDFPLLLEEPPSPGTPQLRAETEILTAHEIEDIIQEIVAIRVKEKLSEEAMPVVCQDMSSLSSHKACYHWERKMPH
ncbi:uncharacterized protein LOC107983216 isoform X2 [Anolis carolinensis]|uniref:uncharacterized protein LOC107983216 isoform X2 n=1 Tax=Anolis carolinensis TaxID=28377 RepID=UPI002F2B6686